MTIITISRGSYSRGKAVAEEVASRLGYECLSRDILLAASKEFNIPEIKLVRALHDAPSVLERFTHGKERYLCHLRTSLLQYAMQGNIVYHGLAGQFFLSGIPHIFKLRIIADMTDRVQEEMRRENISEEEARYILMKDDDERRKWGMQVYGIDTWDSRLYDMVLHIGGLTVDDAADIVCHAVQKKAFQEAPGSREAVEDMYLAAQVQSATISLLPSAVVKAEAGVVSIIAPDIHSVLTDKAIGRITAAARKIEGVKDVLLTTPNPQKNMINPFHNIH
jgi:cytidylate kinase